MFNSFFRYGYMNKNAFSVTTCPNSLPKEWNILFVPLFTICVSHHQPGKVEADTHHACRYGQRLRGKLAHSCLFQRGQHGFEHDRRPDCW